MSDPPRDDVDDLLVELEDTLDGLRETIESSPRPPRSRELLRLTDEYAIPTAIAVLEANIRALELLQGTIQSLDPERAAADARRRVGEGASAVGEASLDRLERTLDEIESAMADAGLPRNREARELLDEARRLNEELRERVAAGEVGPDREAVRIEVESELESIKDEVGAEDADEEP